MSVKTRGMNNFDKAPKIMRAKLERALSLSALAIKTNAQKQFKALNKPYPRKTPDPGKPHIRTGKLRGSIFSLVAGPLARIIGTNVQYGPHLEWGTTRMRARPFMLPGVLLSKMYIRKIFKKLGIDAVVQVRLH